MKGISVLVMAAFLVVTAGIVFSMFDFLIPTKEVKASEVTVKRDFGSMDKALERVSSYLEDQLIHSLRQGCYEILKKGGWNDISSKKSKSGYVYWRDSRNATIKLPDASEFLRGLEKETEDNLNDYIPGTYKFLDNSEYSVKLPDYAVSVFSNEQMPETLIVGATPDKNLHIEKTQEKGEWIKLERRGVLGGFFEIDCFGIYLKGYDKYSKMNEEVRKTVEDVIQLTRWPTEWSVVDLDKDYGDITVDFMFSEAVRASGVAPGKDFTVAGAEGYIKELLEQGLKAEEKREGSYSMKTEFFESFVDIVADEEHCTGENRIPPSPTKKNCTFSYKIVVEVKVTVSNTEEGQRFPVFNGQEISFENLELVFLIRDEFSHPE